MRIWSVHPKHLDSRGLVALWRETLLAKNVLEGNTKGYKNHPQLIRFKNAEKPSEAINQYLAEVYKEAERRKYRFDKTKIDWGFKPIVLKVTSGQFNYEVEHLMRKLKTRDPGKYKELLATKLLETHPLFKKVEGEIEDWEKMY